MSIQVTGVGVAHAPNDRGVATFVARCQDSDVQVALAGAARAARQVVKTADEHGIGPEHRSTTSTSLNPQMDRETFQHVVGYEAVQVLRIVVDDLSRLGPLVAQAVERGEGDVSVQSVQLEVADPDALLVEARDAAFADARARAEQLARLAGRSLGGVREIREGSEVPAGPARARLMSAAAGSVPEFEAGSAGVRVVLDVAFDLG